MSSYPFTYKYLLNPYIEPITSLVPTADGTTLLVSTLDSNIRLLDLSTGQMLNTFSGHKSKDYRIRACFGGAEATVICGDEGGQVWGWDLVDVSIHFPTSIIYYWLFHSRQATFGSCINADDEHAGDHPPTKPAAQGTRQGYYMDGASSH